MKTKLDVELDQTMREMLERLVTYKEKLEQLRKQIVVEERPQPVAPTYSDPTRR